VTNHVRAHVRRLGTLGIAGNVGATGDFRFPNKGRPFLDYETCRFQIALQRAPRLQLAAFAYGDIALHLAENRNRLGFDFAADVGILTDGQDAIRMNLTLDLSVDQKFLLKLN